MKKSASQSCPVQWIQCLTRQWQWFYLRFCRQKNHFLYENILRLWLNFLLTYITTFGLLKNDNKISSRRSGPPCDQPTASCHSSCNSRPRLHRYWPVAAGLERGWLQDLGFMQHRVYENCVNNLHDELTQRLTEVRSGLQQNVIDAVVGKWRKRLQACVRARGRHFEHLLYRTVNGLKLENFHFISRLNVFIYVWLTKWVKCVKFTICISLVVQKQK